MSMGLGSLVGTMTKASPEEELLKLLAAQTQGAAGAATQAAGQYQQAASAPPPELDPMSAFLPALLSNFASVIGGTPAYRENRQQDLHQQRGALLQARAQNLQALRDQALQKAEAAEKLGDMEASTKSRLEIEKLAKVHEKIMEQQRQDHALEMLNKRGQQDKESDERGFKARLAEIAASGAESRKTNAASPTATTDDLADVVESVVAGQSELTNYPIKMRPAIISAVKATGQRIMPKKVRETVNTISSARGVLNQLREFSDKINTAGPEGFLAQGIEATFGGATQRRPDVIVFNALRDGMLATLSRATGERGVLTDRDVIRARKLIPSVWSAKLSASGKLDAFEKFLTELEQRAIRNFTTSNVGGNDPASTASAPQSAKVRIESPTGETGYLDASEVPDAIKRGWKRVP